MDFSKTSNGLGSPEKGSNMSAVSSNCTFSPGLSVLFRLQMNDFFCNGLNNFQMMNYER